MRRRTSAGCCDPAATSASSRGVPIARSRVAAECKTHANLALPKLDPTTYFGYNDPKKARTVTFSGRSLKDYCKKPRPGPAGGGSGGSCPAPTPQARFRAAAGGGSCPQSPGIQVLFASQGNPMYSQVALFKTAELHRRRGLHRDRRRRRLPPRDRDQRILGLRHGVSNSSPRALIQPSSLTAPKGPSATSSRRRSRRWATASAVSASPAAAASSGLPSVRPGALPAARGAT